MEHDQCSEVVAELGANASLAVMQISKANDTKHFMWH